MAIDQEIQRKVDAYRGNPQQLMQRYQQNQQLVDLLALQKLKSEKEAAARDMQLQMQQQPQTIKQQREAELLGMTKQEMMQQTQGVLQQRQAQQQQNMQQVAQQGLGALTNQRPAAPQPAPQGQPMPRMAGGGIVSFQPGGYVGGVTQEEIDAVREAIEARGGAPITDEQIAERIATSRKSGPRPVETAAPIARISDQEERTTAPLGATGIMGQGSMSNGAGAQPAPGGVADLLSAQPKPPVATPPAEAVSGGAGIDALAGGSGTDAVTGGGSASRGGGGGAEGAMFRGFDIADEYTGREEKAQRYTDMESEMRALDAEMYDPREERRDQLKAFLAGTANTTNFGSTMAGGTLASLNLRKQQKADRRERLKDIFEMAERGMTLDSTLAEGGLRLGQTMYSEAMANQRAAISAAASLRSAELSAEIRRAELEYTQLKDDKQFKLDERELEIEEARNEATTALATAENETRAFGAVSLALDRVQDQETAVRQFVVDNSQLPVLQDELVLATDEDEIARIEAAIAAEEARVAIRAEQIFDDMGGVEARDLLAAKLLSFTGTGASMLSLEDVAGIEQIDEE
jgi:hypothetical protein